MPENANMSENNAGSDSRGRNRARGRGPAGAGAGAGTGAGAGGGEGGKDRKRRRERRDEPVARDTSETLIDIYRCSATVKGGRRLSFGALVTVGNAKGRVGIGYAKAKEVPGAIQKAIKKANGALKSFVIAPGDTIPHQVIGRFGASRVILIPARPGTGVIAGAAVKAILEAGGLKNVLTKSIGNTNTRNIVKATLNALEQLRSRDKIASLRGVEL